MRTLARLLAAAALAFALAPAARAQDAFIPPMPNDFDKVDVYLLTVGRGPQIWALFGHTILRVIDRSQQPPQDMNFNWGIFDFYDPFFAWKFYLGDLDYSMIITDYWSLIDGYRNGERRGVISDHLVLTAKQKETLMQRLIWNAQPQNTHYQYSQLRDNCATKPRDHLDAALGGKLREVFGRKPSPRPFRYYIKRDAAPLWWVHMGLDSATNAMLDEPVTVWQQMFLPSTLREALVTLPAFDDLGRPIPGRNLLENAVKIVDLPEPGPSPDPYKVLLLLLGIPLVGLAVWFGRWEVPERRAAVALGLASVAFGLWSAVWGTLLTADWTLSHYAELKHNALLFVFYPIDWLFVVYGVKLLIHRVRPVAAPGVRLVAALHVVGALALTLFWATGITKQDVLPALASSGVLGILYFGMAARHAAAGEA